MARRHLAAKTTKAISGTVLSISLTGQALAADDRATQVMDPETLYSKPAGLAILGGMYAGVYTWTYFAWYKERATTGRVVFENEGLFGADTYAGGSDKLGHFWVNYYVNRISSKILQAGGWSPMFSASAATLTTMGFFTFIEFKDGYHEGFGFSWGDMAFNLGGNVLAGVMTNWPIVDDMFDFKVEYRPSKLYLRSLRNKGVIDGGEDYTGQTFMLTYHLSSLSSLRDHPLLGPARFLDVTLGYRSIHYLPKPPVGTDRKQEISFGVAFNVQELIDLAFDRYREPRGYGHGALRFAFEGFNMPYSYVPLVRVQHNNGPKPSEEPE